MNHNISKYDEAVNQGKMRYTGFQEFREYASLVKEDALLNLPEYLEEFEKNITAGGARVLWARNSGDAIEYIRGILEEQHTRMVVKSKSMITEEIGFNEHAEKWGIETVETDLGEFIVQAAGEKPYHILTPAMHKSKTDIANLFSGKFGTPPDATPEELAGFVRLRLRKLFTEAEVGVTGANFIIADTGGIGITENEGNALMTVSFPEVHIVIAGIERVLPSVHQLPFFFHWLGVHGTGQNISTYNTLLIGPKSSVEIDGPEKMIVILLDNGRSCLLAEKEEYQALKCIRCGACLNACPIYKNVGGYTYSSVYTGPVGSVITPFYNGFREYSHLSYACTVCGRCSEVCPVKIPLHLLLLLNRKRFTKNYGGSFVWNKGMKAYRFAFSKRRRLDSAGSDIKNKLASLIPDSLGKSKKMPEFASRSFNQQWKSFNQ